MKYSLANEPLDLLTDVTGPRVDDSSRIHDESINSRQVTADQTLWF